jgi:hypothetical protein
MAKKLLFIIKDLSLFIFLLCLIKMAVHENISFLNEHSKSLIHELDKSFLDLIYTTKLHIHALQDHPIYGVDYTQQLANLKERITIIEDKYKTNSLGLALLGPLGTTSIVLKEQDLQKKLLAITQEISKILQVEQTDEVVASCKETISKTLQHNKKIIKELMT